MGDAYYAKRNERIAEARKFTIFDHAKMSKEEWTRLDYLLGYKKYEDCNNVEFDIHDYDNGTVRTVKEFAEKLGVDFDKCEKLTKSLSE